MYLYGLPGANVSWMISVRSSSLISLLVSVSFLFLNVIPEWKHYRTKLLALACFGGFFSYIMLGFIPLWQDKHVTYSYFYFLDLGGSNLPGRLLIAYCVNKSSLFFL